MQHPLHQFQFCPKCGAKQFVEHNEKSKKCTACQFIYYFNPSAAAVAVIENDRGEILVARRAKDPAKGTLDLPGGFVDMYETAEEAICREVKEETGLSIKSSQYLFSIPNIYLYSRFKIHTLDLFFRCKASDYDRLTAQDDVSELFYTAYERLDPDKFGLISIRKGVEKLLSEATNSRRKQLKENK
ncbi:MAG: NUDIX domain-containing protein [Proteiniphilum sp.]|jgi:mutator protein MutT|nr:NUDIX domain-containing protein [Proteiniphilum sp.]